MISMEIEEKINYSIISINENNDYFFTKKLTMAEALSFELEPYYKSKSKNYLIIYMDEQSEASYILKTTTHSKTRIFLKIKFKHANPLDSEHLDNEESNNSSNDNDTQDEKQTDQTAPTTTTKEDVTKNHKNYYQEILIIGIIFTFILVIIIILVCVYRRYQSKQRRKRKQENEDLDPEIDGSTNPYVSNKE